MRIGKYLFTLQFNKYSWAFLFGVEKWANLFIVRVLCLELEIENMDALEKLRR
ncbi:MAG: hypothetical protein IIB83_04955 [Bacteroidetes bacterium]|nr:hypothetical protein [Bacteroidota bacterium]